MRWVGHIAYLIEMINSYRILVGRLKAKDHLGDLSIDGRILK
jgi:hypothetical protein